MGQSDVNAVTWGVFPGKEVVQPTVVDPHSFSVWKVSSHLAVFVADMLQLVISCPVCLCKIHFFGLLSYTGVMRFKGRLHVRRVVIICLKHLIQLSCWCFAWHLLSACFVMLGVNSLSFSLHTGRFLTFAIWTAMQIHVVMVRRMKHSSCGQKIGQICMRRIPDHTRLFRTL